MANATNVLPHNNDAEMALLGCMLIDNETAADIVEPLKEEDFYGESNRYVLSAMKRVFGSRRPIDLVTLSDQLESEGNLAKAGGIAYLTELAQITPSAANYKSYFDIVKRDSLSRKLIRASQKIIEACASSTDEKQTLAFAEKSIYKSVLFMLYFISYLIWWQRAIKERGERCERGHPS